MKVELKTDGTMVIYAENSLESYALNYWVQELHFHGDSKSKVQVDLSTYTDEFALQK